MGNIQNAKPMTWGEKLTRENRALKEKIGILKTEAATLQRDLRNTWRLMEALPGEVILVEKGHIIFANEAACDVFGYEKQDLLQMSLASLVHPDSKGFLEDLSERNYSGDRIHDPYEVTFLKKNGERLSCGVGVRAIRRNRKKVFLVNMLEIERIKENERRAGASVNAQTMKRVVAMFDKQMEAFIGSLKTRREGQGKVKREAECRRYPLKGWITCVRSVPPWGGNFGLLAGPNMIHRKWDCLIFRKLSKMLK